MIGNPYEQIQTISDAYTMKPTDGAVVVASGFSGGKTITLPKASACTQQGGNNSKRVINLAGGGGTATIAAASGDTLSGRATVVVAAGAIIESDGQKTWYAY